MSWKSMSGMLTANHGAIGLRSKVRSARRRICVIHSGSPFHHEIWSTTPALRPFSGVKAYSTSSLQPSLYWLRSRSVTGSVGGFPIAKMPWPVPRWS